MPSFDLVSKIDVGELKNAINQAEREISSRYDFKGSKTSITLTEEKIDILGEDDYKIKAARDIVMTKMAKRNIGLKSLDLGTVEPTGNRMLKQSINLKQGIDKDTARIINKMVKDSKMKVSSSVMDDKIRLTGKKIDELQAVFSMLKKSDEIKLELQMENMKRD